MDFPLVDEYNLFNNDSMGAIHHIKNKVNIILFNVRETFDFFENYNAIEKELDVPPKY